jgi:osomolarity two-component system response regulator SKN7
VPAARKNSTRNVNSPAPPVLAPPPIEYARTLESLQGQVDHLTRNHDEMAARLRSVESNYQNVLSELVNFQRNMAQQDGVMQNLIQYFLNIENSKLKTEALIVARNGTNSDPAFGGSTSADSESNPFVPAQEAQRMIGGFTESDVARASLIQMNEIARRAELAGMSFDLGGTSSNATGPASINPVNASLSGVTSTSAGSGSTAATNTAGGVPQQQQTMQSQETPPRPSSVVQRLMAATAGLMSGDNETPGLGTNSAQQEATDSPPRPLSRQDALARIGELQRTRPAEMRLPLPGPSAAFGPADAFTLGTEEGSNVATEPFPTTDLAHQGLQVFTLGHLMPRSSLDDENGNWTFDPESIADAVVLPTPRTADGGIGQSSEGTVRNVSSSERQTLRIRRSTYVPGWSVPPRVLLVEDDAVSRKLSSKFLQIFGCTIDVAVDGVGAVNKMNLEKYDLVLMVRRSSSAIFFLTWN